MAPPPSVTVIEEGRVAVPPPASGDAALPEPALFKLTALDAQWVPLPLIQRVLVFDGRDGAIPPFESVVASLRASLAETVARLLPLAGRIVHLPETGEAAIDCSGSGVAGGVRFVVAECGDADVARVAGDADHDVGLLEQIAPVLDADALPAETMAAQVTRLGGGGVAVGVALHHAVVDGRSVWRFIEAWAACCRGADAWSAAPAPTFDRAAIALPDGEELARTVLRKYAPNLPVVTDMPNYLVQAREPSVQLSRPDGRRLRPRHPQPQAAHRGHGRAAASSASIQLRRPRGAAVDVAHPVQARRRCLPLVLRLLPWAAGPSGGGALIRCVHRRVRRQRGPAAAAAAQAEEPLARWD